MDELERDANKWAKVEKNLDEAIHKLVKELYRLTGRVAYEPLDTKLDNTLVGTEETSRWN